MEAATQAAPECGDKEHLHNLYEMTVADYNRAFAFLRSDLGTLRKADYVKIREYIEVARLKSEDARLALEKHIAEHGC